VDADLIRCQLREGISAKVRSDVLLHCHVIHLPSLDYLTPPLRPIPPHPDHRFLIRRIRLREILRLKYRLEEMTPKTRT
jgi:hypothetical protein